MFPNEDNLYNEEYFDVVRNDRRRQIAYGQDAEKLHKRTSANPFILDYGGGGGEFGAHLKGTYHNYDPFTGNNTLPKRKVDVAVFRGTLQHIYDPLNALLTAKKLLRKGGLLAVLATPDTDSLGYIRWGTLPALDAPRNWIPFGHRMLKNILTRLDFKDIEFKHPYGYPYASPVKNVWNFVRGVPDAFPGNMMECFANA